MLEFIVHDLSVPADKSETWNTAKETESKQQAKTLRNYFTQLAKREGVEDQVVVGGSMIGFAPPILQIFTDAATAQKIEKASNGRLRISGIILH